MYLIPSSRSISTMRSEPNCALLLRPIPAAQISGVPELFPSATINLLVCGIRLLQAQLFLCLTQITQVHKLFRRGRRTFDNAVLHLNLYVCFESGQRHVAVARIDPFLGVVLDTLARVLTLQPEFFGEKFGRIRWMVVNPAQRLDMALQKPDHREAIFFGPRWIDVYVIELIVRN